MSLKYKKLALFKGKPVITKKFPHHKTTGKEELAAAIKVMKKGNLSLFEGNYFAEEPFSYLGGPFVCRFEKKWSDFYNIKYAISVNSCTSGLYAAIGACGIGPGDEVIVSPYTMSASAMCALVYNAIPVFADIDKDTFNIAPDSIEKRITKHTKAIVVVHIMGHPADMDSIMKIAKKHKLRVIEDCAQANGALYKKRLVGTIGDIGVFSLNVNKTIQTGEGGMITCRDEELAKRLRLIRNHGEIVADQLKYDNLNNMLGFNYRMCEIEAAIGIEQLKKLNRFNRIRVQLANHLTKKLTGIKGITPPKVKKECRHVYYVYSIKYDEAKLKVSRDLFCRALAAEGVLAYQGYVKPLYLQQLYQKRLGYGGKGCPFNCRFYKGKPDYKKGICPNAELMYEKQLIVLEMIKAPQTIKDMDLIANAFKKVVANIGLLKKT